MDIRYLQTYPHKADLKKDALSLKDEEDARVVISVVQYIDSTQMAALIGSDILDEPRKEFKKSKEIQNPGAPTRKELEDLARSLLSSSDDDEDEDDV